MNFTGQLQRYLERPRGCLSSGAVKRMQRGDCTAVSTGGLWSSTKSKPPEKNPTSDQHYPDEDQLIKAEKFILKTARDEWRYDHLSALEIFARIQHVGGPTRLIDVSMNPYIAAWFAVEFDEEQEGNDARLFALATKPVERPGGQEVSDSRIRLDDLGGGREPFWHSLGDNSDRQKFDWGTGARRRIWIPPIYDPRISAQNAAFILDGVPIASSRLASHFKTPGGNYWNRADLLASSSIYARMSKPTRRPNFIAHNLAPTFSFRIEAKAKAEIREAMELHFGYRASYLYPDTMALADYLKRHNFG